ncbi:MAG: hypothetical protein ACJ74O_18510 [Frankiaceae bacterium]
MPGPSSTARRWSCRGLAAVGAVIALVTTTGAPADAASAPGLTSTANCAWSNGDGTYTAVFGYTNTSKKTYSIPQGNNNQVYAGLSTSNFWTAVDANPPTTFPPGSVANAVVASFPGSGGAAWSLDGNYVTVTAASTACPASTLATTNDGAATVVAGLIALGAVAVLGRRRGRYGLR